MGVMGSSRGDCLTMPRVELADRTQETQREGPVSRVVAPSSAAPTAWMCVSLTTPAPSPPSSLSRTASPSGSRRISASSRI